MNSWHVKGTCRRGRRSGVLNWLGVFGRHDLEICWQFHGLMEVGEMVNEVFANFPRISWMCALSLKKSSSGLVLPMW